MCFHCTFLSLFALTEEFKSFFWEMVCPLLVLRFAGVLLVLLVFAFVWFFAIFGPYPKFWGIRFFHVLFFELVVVANPSHYTDPLSIVNHHSSWLPLFGIESLRFLFSGTYYPTTYHYFLLILLHTTTTTATTTYYLLPPPPT